MDLALFVSQRRGRWDRLRALLDQAQESSLNPALLQELLSLYRGASSDLNRARSMTANPELLGSLNQLVGRAYRIIYRGRPRTPISLAALRDFFLRAVPGTFRREEKIIRVAALAFLLGTALGLFAVLADPAAGAMLVPREMFTQSPAARVEHIESSQERIDTFSKATEFGSFLYTHNIQVSFLTFALGALTLFGGWLLLFYNGIILGAVAAAYFRDGAGTFFIAWVGPHGVLELPSIVFAGAAGLRFGRAFLLPGERGRPAALREAFVPAFRMLATAAALLVFAGVIEGSFSQMSSKSVAYPIKIATAGVLFAALLGWLFAGRARETS
jgi:uncharacterized membrane protein SpoIIM required for sporulation